MYKIIDGKQIATEIKKEIAEDVAARNASGLKTPHLAAILVGNDGGSETYVAHKVKACEEVGFKSTLIRFPDSITEEVLLAKVRELNEDKSIDEIGQITRMSESNVKVKLFRARKKLHTILNEMLKEEIYTIL